ncbi:phage tail protein [Capnocytophaga canis]|uniref:phage tail protein n=1 Tax=Capnocytophaga canis TaxID=1848903 RepID=UPI0015624516|nr:phage tail protein [Capnocytophaga canis]
MNYQIKRNNNTIATICPEGQLQASVMGEEVVTMTFSLTNYVHFQTGDTVEVYGNIYYLSTEPQIEKISSREFRYSLEFQGIKYELGKVQYLFPDAQNVLNLSEFHIMGTARTMLELLVQNANRTGQGWSLGTVDDTEAKQLNFSAENCLAVLSKIAQEFKLEYWVDGDKSIHLTERKAVSGYSFEYGKAKGLKSLTRQTLEGSNVVTRLYAFGSEKNIAGDYRGGQQKLRMPVPFLEKNTDIYGIIEGSQTFDVFPHRLGTVTAINPSNPLQFSDSGMDFDLNERENGNTKYLINGVPVKVTFNTGQLSGYTFEVKQYGYNTATKTFTLLKNQDEKAIEVPSETLRPAVGDRYVLTDLIMPESYVTNAEQELQQKAQQYLDENSRQRVVYSLVTDPLYFKAQNVNIVLGSTIRAVDTDFNLDDNLRVIRLTKDLQNPYNVQFEVAERAEIAYIVREYFEEEKSKVAMVQADKFNAEMARRAYRFGKEISENVFDGEGYFNAEKIKPLSIETKLLSVGSRMQQFSLPDVVISVENATTVRNTQGKIVHLTLEENPREWQIPANTQTGITEGFNYIYIKAQRIGSNASVFVSPEKIAVDSDVAFYHFEAGYLGSVESGNRRIRMSHGFTQINPFEITTGRIAPPSGNHYIELTQDSINVVGNLHITDGNVNQIKQSISPDLLNLENRLKQYTDNVQIGGRNLLRNSKYVKKRNEGGGIAYVGEITEMIAGQTYIITAKKINGRINEADFYLNERTDWWNATPQYITMGVPFIATHNYKHLWVTCPYNGTEAEYQFIMLEKGNKATDWSPAPEDLESQIQTEQQARQNAIDQAKSATEAYARAQAELARTLAIANADGKITEAEQRQINNATQKLQEAKTFAEQKVNGLQIGGRNLVLKSKEMRHYHSYMGHTWNFSEPMKVGEKYTFSCEAHVGGPLWCYFLDVVGQPRQGIKWLSEGRNEVVVIPNYAWSGLRIYHETYHNVYSWAMALKMEKGEKATDWSPAPEDVEDNIKHGNLYVKGTGYDRLEPLQIKLNDVNIEGSYGRGLKLMGLNRSTLQVVINENYDVFSSVNDINALANRLNGLGSDHIIMIASYDAISCNEDLINAMHRCGASIEASRLTWRLPYALVGIPGIGKGAGIEVYTSAGADAPFAEISTKIINGTPQGINTSAVGLVNSIASDLQTAINNAKALLEAEINNVNSITQKLSAKADFLSETKIDGNTVATGAMLVGNVLGGNAGVNGSGLASTDVRFFAGSSFANRGNAPFRVLDDGSLYSTKGSIAGIAINQNGLGTDNSGFGFSLDNGKYFHINNERISIWSSYNNTPHLNFPTHVIRETIIRPSEIVVEQNDNGGTTAMIIRNNGIYKKVGNTETKIL